MTSFNLSDWAIRHRSFVLYLMVVAALAGLWAYTSLGREEDPPFTIKTMVIKTMWPGADTNDTVEQVTDRIEKKLEELPNLDYVKSYTKPGESVVFVNLKDTVGATEVLPLWYQVRKKMDDIKSTMPSGVQGPFYNDEFGDTYSLIYALSSDGLSHRQLKDLASGLRADFLRVPDVAKVDLVGQQDEKIYLEFSTQKVAALGLDVGSLSQALQAQNALTPSGTVDAGPERIAIRVTGEFTSEESLKAINFYANGHYFRLGDVAEVKRSYSDPAQQQFRFNGEPAIGIAIAMTSGGDALALGEHVKDKVAEMQRELPAGVDLRLVADQSHVVEESVGEFTKSLGEAIAIVLAVSFLALGWRPGIVVAVAIPLVLAITFVAMQYFGISLQRISLGALIIALGLLVDDAMIAVEMMISKMEEGHDKISAATYAYTSTAFPMLTGTLVTIAGFVPVGFAQSGAGEYCFSLFAVVGIALVVSWVVAVLFTPLTGVAILPERLKGHGGHGSSRFSRGFRAVLDLAMRMKWVVLGGTAGLFALSVLAMGLVPQEFFPKSDRPEVMVDLTLPRTASLQATQATVERVETLLKADPDIDHWSFYVGQGAVRFYLPLDAQLANDFFAQAVVVTKGHAVRQAVIERLEKALSTGFDDVMSRVTPLELGPPVGWPLKFRVSGPDAEQTRDIAQRFAQVIGENASVRNINYDWNEPAKVIKVEVDQDRARALGISSQHLSDTINSVLSGSRITQMRDRTWLIDVVARAIPEERASIDTLRTLTISAVGGQRVPIEQVAKLSYQTEPPLIWRRGRLPTVTVQADVVPGADATAIVKQLEGPIAAFEASLPAGYDVALGGVMEDSAKAQASIFVVFPLMLFIMMTVLMVQLMSIQRLFLVLLTAPLALIGVAGALLISGAPMGFVAILGVMSLIGMVIRNSVILISQIDEHIAGGEEPWAAVISATEHRLRPILLTAAAAILGMIPIAPTVFWGPMAYAVMGGLVVATALTLVFLPTLYVTWFRIKAPAETAAAEPVEAIAEPQQLAA
ncbi:efflux RND transporter permease subunit [Mesorhizobium amorphae]|uniref:RND efflux transporter n=1 Tax=Mesorhizobium amorphae CCNWGS0123 TaxID=1082933 RepID=G6YC56_9HYPH|nr:efflux RND transporter permease subunit [Mesorhizobium amorphae]ANT51313.1 ACR family transporter [Mesorhizobium amorphae CCNWGS0123]EHH10730.1 RND efflux transporter [Mesorhizobium amorphae CCNWGS0123]GLR45130.1 ACR family transporter [Mesorhizobium amorphae]